MAITYPLTPPAALTTALARWTGMTVVAVQASAFTGHQQVVAHPGSWWEVDLEIPVRTRAQADEVEGFLLALNGPQGTFYYGDRTRTSLRVPFAGVLATSGSSNTAGVSTLNLNMGSYTLNVGDWLQIGAQLFRVTKKNTSTQVEVFPKLRSTIAPLTTVIVNNTVGRFRLKSVVPFEVRNDRLGGPYRISLKEVVT